MPTPTDSRTEPAAPLDAPSAAPRALAPGQVLAGRYRIEAALGQGGMGVVYRARDQQTGNPVAIKTLFAPPGVDEGVHRFQREFRALTRLQHPRIVRVFDYGEIGGAPFYVMEFIAGSDLAGLRRARGGRLPIRDAISIGMQLCDALAYIHAQGIIHRDLKPSNVMLDQPLANNQSSAPPDSLSPLPSPLSIKLVDFGLAKLTDATLNLTQSGIMLGTVNYMSPEQGQALPIDPRADLYSLGVMLFELTAGQVPFIADTPIAVLLQHITQSPPPLRSLDPTVPPEFEALVLALLSKRPNDRPPSADAVLSVLAGLTSLAAPAPIEIVAAPRADAVFRAGLIGRQAELDRLNQYLEQAWQGEGKLVVIEGEAGVGKTRLASELGGQVRLRGGLRLTGACHEAERVPYGPVAEWLDEALKREGDAGEIVSGLEPELARLVPRLLPPGAVAPDGQLDPQQARLRFFDAVMRLLARLAERRPLMLLLDDIQWADEATLELLHYLVRNARSQRVFICATARREERADAGPLATLWRDLSRLRLLERIELERLSPQATRDLVAAMLGLDQAPSELAGRIYTESEGNPFFIEELLKALAEEGLLVRREGRWTLQADVGMTMLRIPSTIVDVIERRLARLAEAHRSVLNWAAVLGGEFVYDVLRAASGLDEEALLDALDSLLRDQLIAEAHDPRQDRYRFTHAKIRQVVYTALSSARRKKMHRSTGQALEKLYAARLEEMSPVLAHHFTQGGDVPKALQYNVMAGDRARKVYANQEAIAFYRQAIELVEGQPQPAEVNRLIAAHRGLGQVYHLIGEYAPAASSFQAILDLAPHSDLDESERARLAAQAWRELGQTYETRGEYEQARRCYEQGLSHPGASDVAERARLMNAIAVMFIHQGDYERAKNQCEETIRAAPNVPDIVATAYGYLGEAARLQGEYGQAEDYYLKCLAFWENVGDKSQIAKTLNELGNLAEERGAYDRAVAYYQQSLSLCRQVGHSLGTAFLLNNLGVIYQNRGQVDMAHDHLGQSLDIFQRIGSKEGVAIVYNNLAELCLTQGQPEQAMAYVRQAESITRDIGDRAGLIDNWLLMARVEWAEQHLDEAQALVRQALAMAAESDLQLYVARSHQLLGRIYLRAGQTDAAHSHLTQACAIFESAGNLPELASARELLAAIEAGQQNPLAD